MADCTSCLPAQGFLLDPEWSLKTFEAQLKTHSTSLDYCPVLFAVSCPGARRGYADRRTGAVSGCATGQRGHRGAAGRGRQNGSAPARTQGGVPARRRDPEDPLQHHLPLPPTAARRGDSVAPAMTMSVTDV